MPPKEYLQPYGCWEKDSAIRYIYYNLLDGLFKIRDSLLHIRNEYGEGEINEDNIGRKLPELIYLQRILNYPVKELEKKLDEIRMEKNSISNRLKKLKHKGDNMPLKKGYSKKSVSKNIATEMKHGKSRDQTTGIAMSVAEKAK